MNQQLPPRVQRLHGFQRQIDRLEGTRSRLERLSNRLANLRLIAAGLGLLVSTAALFLLQPIGIAGIIFTICLIVFLALVIAHRRVNFALKQYQGWQVIKRDHIARMQQDWKHIPHQNVTSPEGHPFAFDIDLPLVHRLICTAATPQAAQRLYGWLLTQQPQLRTIEQRQRAVKELAPRRLFRTRLALYGQLHRDALRDLNHGDDVMAWLSTRHQPAYFRVITFVTFIAALVQIIALAGSRLGLIASETWLITFAIYAGLFLFQRRRAGNLFREASALHDMLDTLGHIMIYLETRRFPAGSELARLCAPLVTAKPSRHLRRLAWLASGASLQGNFILWFAIHSVLPLDLLVALGLYHEKEVLLKNLPDWLEHWFELDALSSLAAYADLHPDYTFPLLREGEPVLIAESLAHPLIAMDAKVANDLRIEQTGTIYLLTGSNMSGKSTFLRTIGVNLSVAQAGGPVDATRFEASPMRLYTSMRITDSIPEGLSYFYAEVKRLRGLLDAVQSDSEFPVCFLIDEIFRGTNNRERLIGSQAYLKALIGQRGIGLIATHDLELAQLADDQPLLHNFHFEERVEDGRLIFDYRLKAGPSTSTNALLIMRAEGLPVDL